MNQGIPFARTIRALDADDFRTSRLGLFLAAAVIVAWVWWAFAARVPQYETSANGHFDAAGQSAIAYFPASAGVRIRVGQPALLRTTGASINAVVTDSAETPDGQVRVSMRLAQYGARLTEPVTVDVETERVSPAVIGLRAAGLGDR